MVRALDERLSPRNASVQAQTKENTERAGPGHADFHHAQNVTAVNVYGLGQSREFFEGVAQQNQGQDFKLLAHGLRQRRGDHENQTHDLHAQNQGEGQVNGIKVTVRRLWQPEWIEAQAFQLHARQGSQINPEQNQGHTPLRGRPFPEMVQPVEHVGERLKFVNQHKTSVLRGLRADLYGVADRHEDSRTGANVKGGHATFLRHSRNPLQGVADPAAYARL